MIEIFCDRSLWTSRHQVNEVQMNIMEIAKKLIGLCRQGKNDDALTTLLSTQAVSVESFAPPGGQQEAKGLEAIRSKSKW